MNTLDFKRRLPVKYAPDLCVVGAGPAGVAAAVAAAQTGARTLLIEAQSFSGGMSTAALVPIFMPFTDGEHFLAGGVGETIYRRLRESCIDRYGFDCHEAIPAELLKLVYDQIIEEAGVQVLYRTEWIGCETNSGTVTAAVFSSPGGLFAVEAPIFIDCTGDARLAFEAGAPVEFGDETGQLMPATLCSLWCGVDWQTFEKQDTRSHADPKLLDLIRLAYSRGELSREDLHHTGIFRTTPETGAGNISHVFQVDPTDTENLTAALIEARRTVTEYEHFYRKYIAGFQSAEIATTGALLGIRESRRIQGEYRLTLEDYCNRASFPDEIGRYNFPVDIHPSDTSKETLEKHRRMFDRGTCGPGESYGIPFRSLLPKNTTNLLVAGRCISADRSVMASVRVIPGCYITGMAAGTAAALCIKAGCPLRELPPAALRAKLREHGAYLPEQPEVKP